MKKQIIIIIILFILLVFAGYLISSSGGKTGSSQTGCICHGIATDGNSIIEISSEPDIFTTKNYHPAETYKLSLIVTGGPSTDLGGFNLRVTDGILSNPGANARIENDEATHSSNKSRNWSIDWTAPDAAVDSVTFYYVGNTVNGADGSQGDDPTVPQIVVVYPVASYVNYPIARHSADFQLFQNYPNPFNPVTHIPYQIDKAGKVELKIYNVVGEIVYESTANHLKSGQYQFTWQGISQQQNRVASGVYFGLVTFNQIDKTQKLILIR